MTQKVTLVVLDDNPTSKPALEVTLASATAARNWEIYFPTAEELKAAIGEQCAKIRGMGFQAQGQIDLVQLLLDTVSMMRMEPIAVILGTPLFELDLRYWFSKILARRFRHVPLIPLTDDASKPISRLGISDEAARDMCELIHRHAMSMPGIK